MILKQCNRCLELLDVSMFHKDKHKKDGYHTICKACCHKHKAANKEKIAAYNREYGKTHKKWAAVRKNRTRNANIEYYRFLRREWARKNPERNAEHKRKDYEKHRDKYVLRACVRIKRVKGLENTFSVDNWRETLARFDGQCAYCGARGKLEREHVVPVMRSGAYIMGNIIPACKRCNQSKHDKDLMEWYPRQVFYDEHRMSKICEFVSEYANQSGSLTVTG